MSDQVRLFVFLSVFFLNDAQRIHFRSFRPREARLTKDNQPVLLRVTRGLAAARATEPCSLASNSPIMPVACRGFFLIGEDSLKDLARSRPSPAARKSKVAYEVEKDGTEVVRRPKEELD